MIQSIIPMVALGLLLFNFWFESDYCLAGNH